MTLRLTCWLVFGLLVLGVSPGTTEAQNIETEIELLSSRVEQAQSENLHLITPQAFRAANEQLQRAREKLRSGDKISDIRETVQRGQAQILKAGRLKDIGDVILDEAITARNDALEARSPQFASELWTDAEDQMYDAGREIEKGDQNDARENASEAVQLYREAELKAIRADVLGTARTLRTEAREAEAEKFARETWRDAEQKLQRAEQVLQGDRYDRSSSRDLARQAGQQYQHATLIAERARQIDDDLDKRVEETILTYEAEIRRVANALGSDVSFSEGLEPAMDRLVAATNSLKEDRANVQQSFTDSRERIDRLQQVIDSLDARLAELEQREQSMSAELQQKRERERTLERVRDIFSGNEAEVLLRGNELLVRMQGLNFPVGSSEIRPENFSLLTKVQRVLREFPDGDVVISGHTDAQGNDDTNQKLSEERAEAVREYLLANMSVPAERIASVGFGESQPIATNETEEGRAKNRRIDVKIDVSGQ